MNNFLIFWSIYPRRVAKLNAERAYNRAISQGAKPEEILEGVKKYVRHIQEKEIELKFIKHATTFLNGGCWMDEYEANMPKSEERPSNVSYLADLWRRVG